MSLAIVCAQIAAVAGRPESGIAAAHNAPPESLGRRFPVSWVNPVGGDVERISDEAMWLHRVELIVYVTPREDELPVEFAYMAPLVNSVEATFWAAFLNNDYPPEIDHIVVNRYSLGIREFAGDPYHTITFSLDVKEHTA